MKFAATIALAAFTAVASAAECEMRVSVSNGQTQACGSGACIPGGTNGGSAILLIDGGEKWDGGSYDELSTGDGTDFEYKGVKGHIKAIGLPARNDDPTCKIETDDGDIEGDSKEDAWGLPGTFGQKLACEFKWDC